MHITEHPPPHFHAQYGEKWIVVNIKTLEVIAGKFPPNGLKLVKTWGKKYRNELLENWDLATQKASLNKIKPLD